MGARGARRGASARALSSTLRFLWLSRCRRMLRIASRALGGSRDAVRQALAGLELDCLSPAHEYWPLDIDLRDWNDSLRLRLIGPNQVADMQQLLLAHRHRGQLATFDTGLRELASGTLLPHPAAIIRTAAFARELTSTRAPGQRAWSSAGPRSTAAPTATGAGPAGIAGSRTTSHPWTAARNTRATPAVRPARYSGQRSPAGTASATN